MEKELKDKLKERVEAFNNDEDEIAIYSDYTRGELEYNTVIEDARDEGEAKGKIEQAQADANAMLKENMNVEFISRITKLPIREIEMLR